MPTIVVTYICASSHGQRTHSARTKTRIMIKFIDMVSNNDDTSRVQSLVRKFQDTMLGHME